MQKSATFGPGSMGVSVSVRPDNAALLQVVSVAPNSQAQVQGVVVGDLVIGINGQGLQQPISSDAFVFQVSNLPRPVTLNLQSQAPLAQPVYPQPVYPAAQPMAAQPAQLTMQQGRISSAWYGHIKHYRWYVDVPFSKMEKGRGESVTDKIQVSGTHQIYNS